MRDGAQSLDLKRAAGGQGFLLNEEADALDLSVFFRQEAPVWLGEFGTNGYWTTALWWMEVGEVLWLKHLLRYMRLGIM